MQPDGNKSFFNPIYSSNGAGIVDIDSMNAFTSKSNSFMSEGSFFFFFFKSLNNYQPFS